MNGLHVAWSEGTLVIAGEFDMSNAASVWAEIARHSEPGDTVRVDLTEVTFMDSAALAALLRATRDRTVELTGCSDQVARLLEISGTCELFVHTAR